MKKTNSNTKTLIKAGRASLAVGMMMLLLLLTTINFFVYGSSQDNTEIVLTADAEEESSPCSPSGPDEKAPGGSFSFSEEYIHGHDELSDPFLINTLFEHMVTASEKIELVHFELLSPPPEV